MRQWYPPSDVDDGDDDPLVRWYPASTARRIVPTARRLRVQQIEHHSVGRRTIPLRFIAYALAMRTIH